MGLNDKPTYDELIARIEALEGQKLSLQDLPLKPLMNKLEQSWQPNASVLLGSNSITPEMLASAFDLTGPIKLRIGTGVTTSWPGGSARSSVGAVLHGLGATPKIVLPMTVDNAGLTADPVIICFGYTATQFSYRAQTVDGQLPTGVTTPTFNWLAIG